MALTDFYFCNGGAGDVTAAELQFGRERLPRHVCFFSEYSDIVAEFLFKISVQNVNLSCAYIGATTNYCCKKIEAVPLGTAPLFYAFS